MPEQLPVNLEAERFVLSAAFLQDGAFSALTDSLSVDDFSLSPHQHIWRALAALHKAGDHIDRMTLASWLQEHGKLEAAGGLGYLVELDAGVPKIIRVDVYAGIVRNKATLRRAILEADAFMKAALSNETTEELLQRAEGVHRTLSAASRDDGGWFTPGEIFEACPDTLMPKRGGDGIPTAWPRLTELLCGYHPGELLVVAARPSMGKTALMLQDAEYQARNGVKTAIVSLEMRKEALMQRLLCMRARVDYQRFRAGMCSQDERRRVHLAGQELCDLPMFIRDVGAKTAGGLRAAIRKLSAKHGSPRVVYVDYLQRMDAHGENRNHEIAAITGAAKQLGMDTGSTVVLLSQLSRECEKEKRRPHLGDLRDGGSIEQDADGVIFVHREERYHPTREDLRGLAEFIIAKQRNGPLSTLNMVWLGQYQKFEEKSYDERDNAA